MRKTLWIVAGILFAIATLAINYEVKVRLYNQGGKVTELGPLKLGQPVPDFTLNDLSNRPVTLSSYRGQKVVLLDFWATWCGPCRMAMPDLQKLADKFATNGLEILSVNQGEPADQVSAFIQRRKYTFHVVLDLKGEVGDTYGVQGIPTLVLVDKKGDVQWIRVGYSPDETELDKQVAQLTKE